MRWPCQGIQWGLWGSVHLPPALGYDATGPQSSTILLLERVQLQRWWGGGVVLADPDRTWGKHPHFIHKVPPGTCPEWARLHLQTHFLKRPQCWYRGIWGCSWLALWSGRVQRVLVVTVGGMCVCVCREGGGSEDGGGAHTTRSAGTCWQEATLAASPSHWSSASSPAGWFRQRFLLQGLQWDTGLLFPITLLLGHVTLKPALVLAGAPLQQVGVHGMGDGSPGTRGKSPAPCQGLPHVITCHPPGSPEGAERTGSQTVHRLKVA